MRQDAFKRIYLDKLFNKISKVTIEKQRNCSYLIYTTGNCQDNKHVKSNSCVSRIYNKENEVDGDEWYAAENCLPDSHEHVITLSPTTNQVNNKT